MPFPVLVDEAASYMEPRLPLSNEQRAAVRSFRDAVERVLSTLTIDNPRPDA